MMSTESANSFTLIGEASDGGTMENLSRRLKASVRELVNLDAFEQSISFSQRSAKLSCKVPAGICVAE